MKKTLLTLSVLSTFALTAQAQTTIFEEKFNVNDDLRHPSPYAAKGTNAFIFADPQLTYPGDNYAANYSRFIENNHYAVVRPAQIYYSVPQNLWIGGYSSHYLLWSTRNSSSIVNYGLDADGTTTGGAMVVNAGRTPGILYQKPDLRLEYGKYYKLSYKIWIEHPNVRLKVNFLDQDGITNLGEQLGTYHSGTSNENTGYFTENYYFYLSPSACTNDYYTMNIQNNDLNDQNLDFVLDNILLEELASQPTSVTISTIQAQCVVSNVPVLTNDYANGFTLGSSASINPLTNDDIDGNNTQATTSNATFRFEVPLGAYKEQWSEKIVVPGEGAWVYSNGTVTFTPESSFKGNPTPVTYRLTNSAIITSHAATITLEYVPAAMPNTSNDTTKVQLGSGPYVTDLSIFGNDKTGGNATPTPQPTASVFFKNPMTGTIFPADMAGGIYVSGEGTWTYNPTTGKATFTPITGFTTLPTPIQYSYTESGNRSNWSYIIFESSTPLPIQLLSFEGKQQANGIALHWLTASEKNNAYFELERNNNQSGWTAIAKIASKAENDKSSHTLAYQFEDQDALSGNVLYRLKQVDKDGSTNYSRVLIFTLYNYKVSVYPNPSNNVLNVAFQNNNTAYAIQIVNSFGAVVYNASNIKDANYSIATSTFASGVYSVRILTQGKVVHTEKVVIQK